MNGPTSFCVIIPLYNKAAYIEACLTSVLCQSLPPKQVIIVDDGSSDEGLELIVKNKDPRIQIVRQLNAGPGAARNKGIKLAKMPWVSFIDADDIWHPDHLLIHSDAISQNPEAGTIGSKFFPSKTPEKEIKNLSPKIGHSHLIDYIKYVSINLGKKSLGSELLYTSSASVRLELLRSIGGFKTTYPGEDTATWLRLALEAPIATTNECTVSYRQDTGGIMSEKKDWSPEKIRAHPLRLELLKAIDTPRFNAHRQVLRAYLNAVDANSLRGALYDECPDDARRLSKLFDPVAVAQAGTSHHLLKFPPEISILLVRCFKLLRRLQLSFAGEQKDV